MSFIYKITLCIGHDLMLSQHNSLASPDAIKTQISYRYRVSHTIFLNSACLHDAGATFIPAVPSCRLHDTSTKISYRNESYRREFTPVIVPERDFIPVRKLIPMSCNRRRGTTESGTGSARPNLATSNPRWRHNHVGGMKCPFT